MIYFDTDVLIHLLVPQDPIKHQLAKSIYKDSTEKGRFFISLLCLQETAFVLRKLGQVPSDIDDIMTTLLSFRPAPYTSVEMKRGIQLARIVGFQNINDCIHTAIAEKHCSELYTFNKTDFQRIKKQSKLIVTLL